MYRWCCGCTGGVIWCACVELRFVVQVQYSRIVCGCRMLDGCVCLGVGGL